MIHRRILQLGAVVGVVGALAGCQVLKTPPPVQTYRFGLPAELPAVGDNPSTTTVAIRRIEFPTASGSDRILGVTGTETAYIGGARWVSPAATLFDESLKAAFATRADRIRVLDRREPGASPLVLQVSISTFEARYSAPGAAPDVVISARGLLRSTKGQGRTIERVFTVTQPAAENRVSAIVDAFDVATRDINTQIADWTIQSAK